MLQLVKTGFACDKSGRNSGKQECSISFFLLSFSSFLFGCKTLIHW